jgi:hypothetical protein
MGIVFFKSRTKKHTAFSTVISILINYFKLYWFNKVFDSVWYTSFVTGYMVIAVCFISIGAVPRITPERETESNRGVTRVT